MQDEAPPWVGSVGERAAATVDARVVAGTALWLVAFGWYVVLQADPRADLALSTAAYLYGTATFLAGLCFGAGEDQLARLVRAGLDRQALAFGGFALGVTGLAWFQLRVVDTRPYVGGLWLGVLLLAAGIALGVASR